jgi:hypothetical protein
MVSADLQHLKHSLLQHKKLLEEALDDAEMSALLAVEEQ